MSVPTDPPQQPPSSGQPPYPPQPVGPAPLSREDERTWAIVAHLAPPVLAILSVGTLGFLTPLVVWLVFRDRSRFVGDQAKEALNFQITLLIAYVVGWLLVWVLIGFVILAAVWVCSIVFGVLAAVAVNRFEPYRYPINIRFVR
ncbi:DUF4870 domain-containing protein [Isoptericola variabilis]|uniref:DUF4870 domain-containing protein n=1 Tax=Isoptericola variabilis (strain 225) TaxID=743718 RepID=F6FXJ5_ISOV2|nr:DUF4870 domain-containing protein [Isoptericola variabilis]AEG44723.1 hypothetical protein Isova_1986 [Isoptericola variabilis 225]TWH27138.1 hypothetical protein L600_005200000050 [Isoptericola variabilis J7]